MPIPSQEYRVIPLTKGQTAMVDASDFEHLSIHKWNAFWNKNTRSFYANRSSIRVNGKQTTIWMHREILGLKKGDLKTGDHRNHNTLDNRRDNLRIATRTQQQRNKRKNQKNTSGFKGVYPKNGRYAAQIKAGGKQIYLGTRDTAEAAHELYREAALRLHGEFAHF
jgi:hypothetical protein